jgi:hypothetical protein
MLRHELNCNLLLDYKLTLPKYSFMNTRYIELEVQLCAVAKNVREFSPNFLFFMLHINTSYHICLLILKHKSFQ